MFAHKFLYLDYSSNKLLQTIKNLVEVEKLDPSIIRNYTICTANKLGRQEVVNYLKQDIRVQLTSYLLGQTFHNKEDIDNLKKTKPYLFI